MLISFSITWDGVDGSASLNNSGLGGLNLSAQGDRFTVDAGFREAGTLFFDVYSNGSTDFSRYTLNYGPQGFPRNLFAIDIPFADFVTLFGSGADFSNVGAIELSSPINNNFLILDNFSVQFSPVPEMETYGAFAALGCFGFVMMKRLRDKRALAA